MTPGDRMTDLDTLRETPVPRPAALCRRLARRIDSIWGFVAYGALWFFVACLFATAALFAGIALVGPSPSGAAKVLVFGAWAGAFIGAWVLFALWVRRRIGPAVRLFRDGTFVEGTVHAVRHLTIRGAPFCHATLHVRDGGTMRSAGLSLGGHPPQLAQGATIPVLMVPHYDYCAAFPIAGRIVPASLGGVVDA